MSEEPTGALRARCEDEVLELHRFFQDWMRGAPEVNGEAFSRVSEVLGEGFQRIAPDGSVEGRSEILASLRAAHGSKSAGFAIRIERCRFRSGGRSLGVVTYEEWHDEGDEKRGRMATAVFRGRGDAPNGVEWVHLHETWMRDS